VNDDVIFRSLGFDEVESIDADNFENATHIIDFNQELPLELNERFDVVFDGGTLEHIFNIPQCLKNIYKMLKPGGIIIHASPSNNHVDHGFYQLSPTFFYDYYSANNWELLRSYMFEYSAAPNKPWIIYNYEPGTIVPLTTSGRAKFLGLWFVAKKHIETRCDVIPQQGAYIKTWKEFESNGELKEIKSEVKWYGEGKFVRLKKLLNRMKLLIYYPSNYTDFLSVVIGQAYLCLR
jgi:SAM-dependent methyltransferase